MANTFHLLQSIRTGVLLPTITTERRVFHTHKIYMYTWISPNPIPSPPLQYGFRILTTAFARAFPNAEFTDTRHTTTCCTYVCCLLGLQLTDLYKSSTSTRLYIAQQRAILLPNMVPYAWTHWGMSSCDFHQRQFVYTLSTSLYMVIHVTIKITPYQWNRIHKQNDDTNKYTMDNQTG